MGARSAVGVGGVYLDASAVVKLLVPERETTGLLAFLARSPVRVSSAILAVELMCVCHRQRLDPADGRELLSGLMLLPLSADVIQRACVPFSPPQRALDALHLATAQLVADTLDCFITYDDNQAQAAERLGWQVQRPGTDTT